MSVFKVVAGAPGWLLGRVVTVGVKVVPGPVKRWVVGQVVGAAATKVGGDLRRQVEKEKAMEATTGTKPGYQTSEFWLTCLAQLISGLYASGAIGDSTVVGKLLAIVASVLVTAGYTVSRGVAKSGSAEPTKPGWKTTEFWLTLASTAVAMITASGAAVIGTPLGKIVEFATMLLGVFGYNISRGIAKSKMATGLIIAPAGDMGS